MKKLFVVITCITSICLMNLLCGCGKSDKHLNQEAERIFKELSRQNDTTLLDAFTIIDNYESQKINPDPSSQEAKERRRLYWRAQKYVNNKILAIAPEYIDNTDKDNPRVEPKIYIRVMRLCGLSAYQFKDDEEVTFDGPGWKILFFFIFVVIAVIFQHFKTSTPKKHKKVPPQLIVNKTLPPLAPFIDCSEVKLNVPVQSVSRQNTKASSPDSNSQPLNIEKGVITIIGVIVIIYLMSWNINDLFDGKESAVFPMILAFAGYLGLWGWNAFYALKHKDVGKIIILIFLPFIGIILCSFLMSKNNKKEL